MMHAMDRMKADRWPFAALSGTVFLYVLLRAALIPIVLDESTSFLMFVQDGAFLPFHSQWDANNHFLNSFCGWVGWSLGGLHLLSLRWASVLSFALFAFSAWRIGMFVQGRIVRWCLWLALLGCPFLLDFFSLFRGYGPAMAFLLLSLEATLSYA
ncbi:MAG TPA: hypothetical protein PK760_10975, partial [Flavobacteriales bacterium]|nr:hypothetical protein [Flavobacteriales bacterium]